MARLRFSRRAEAELLNIGGYTLRTSGEEQASRYLDQIETCCRTLGGSPAMGRLSDSIRPGLRRYECGQHVIFYRQDPKGILVVRILHGRVLPQRHSYDEEGMG